MVTISACGSYSQVCQPMLMVRACTILLCSLHCRLSETLCLLPTVFFTVNVKGIFIKLPKGIYWKLVFLFFVIVFCYYIFVLQLCSCIISELLWNVPELFTFVSELFEPHSCIELVTKKIKWS